MNNEGKFTYNGKCCMVFYERYRKSFYLAIYTNDSYMETEQLIDLFPVKRFSEAYKLIAFNIANKHVLPSIIK